MSIRAYTTGDNISTPPSSGNNQRVCHTTMQRMAKWIKNSTKIAWTGGSLHAAQLQRWAVLRINCKAILAQDPKLWEEIGQQRLKKPTAVDHSGTQMYDLSSAAFPVRSRATTLISESNSPFQKLMGKGKEEEESFEIGGMPYCSPSYEGSGRSTTPATGLF